MSWEISTTPVIDRNEGRIAFIRSQDCEDIIDDNKRLQNEYMPRVMGDDWRKIAAIPNIILEQWLIEEWRRGNLALKLTDKEFDQIVARKLRDPDWKWLRTDK